MNRQIVPLVVGILLFAGADSCLAQSQSTRLPEAKPEAVGLDAARLDRIDQVVQEAIAKHQLPGAVVLVVRDGKCFSQGLWPRSLQPSATP